MRGLSSCSSFGMLRLIILSPSAPADSFRPQAGPPIATGSPCGGRNDISDLLLQSRYLPRRQKCHGVHRFFAQPLADAAENPASREPCRMRRFGAFGTSRTAAGPPRRRKAGPCVDSASPLMRAGRPIRTCLSRMSPARLAHAMQLAGAAGQTPRVGGDLVEAARSSRFAHHLETSPLRARDDADQQGFSAHG